MIIFLYGEDDFSSRQKLKEIKKKFQEKNPCDVNFSQIDFEEKENKISIHQLSSELLSLPLFSKSRLLIIKNVFKSEKEIQESLISILEKIPKSTVVVFWERQSPKKSSKLFKKLIEKSKNKEFKAKNDLELSIFIEKKVKESGSKIDPGAKKELISRTARDIWKISSEIYKLTLFNKKINLKIVKKMVNDSSETKIFSLIDALAEKNSKKAMEEFGRLRKSEHGLYILTMIIFGFKNLLLLSDYLRTEKKDNLKKAAKDLKIHPFVVNKTYFSLKNFKERELRNIYKKLLQIDVRIKQEGEESEREVERFIFELCH
jgi:DNA polymerase-3 subunit delta